MRWNDADNLLDVYFAEAKLYASISDAVRKAFSDIRKFHEDGIADREFGLVTSHYKWADDATKKLVLQFIDQQDPVGDHRINHACLIGYDWKEYKKLLDVGRGEFIKNFVDIYREDTGRILKLMKNQFKNPTVKKLRFEIFFLPFSSVQEFRDAFNEALK